MITELQLGSQEWERYRKTRDLHHWLKLERESLENTETWILPKFKKGVKITLRTLLSLLGKELVCFGCTQGSCIMFGRIMTSLCSIWKLSVA